MRDKDIVADIGPGLVLHLNPKRLLATGAKVTGPAATWVEGDHFFLCVGLDGKRSRWVPLLSNPGKDRVLVSPEGRSGHEKWTGGTFHFHTNQIWTVGADAVVRGAEDGKDQSQAGARNRLSAEFVPEV